MKLRFIAGDKPRLNIGDVITCCKCRRPVYSDKSRVKQNPSSYNNIICDGCDDERSYCPDPDYVARITGERKPRKPKWDPTIKHKTETFVSIPNIPIKGIDQDLVAKLEWDPISQGWEGQVDVMDTTVKAWGLKPKELQKSLLEKVLNLVHDMGWDVEPIRASWISRTHQAFVLKLRPNTRFNKF
jgi:hypothetical protein